MAYPVSAAAARPRMAYPPPASGRTPPQPAPQPVPYDMSRFDAEFAELQRMIADLDGDGIPDAEQGRAPPAEASGPDVAALGQEARQRIQAGEPRESVIQDLFLRVTRGRAGRAGGGLEVPAGGAPEMRPPQRMAQAGPQTLNDAGPQVGGDPMMAPPMAPMPRGRRHRPRFSDLPMPADGGNDAHVMTRPPGSFDLPDATNREDSADAAQQEFAAVRDYANREMMRGLEPEPEVEQPWRGWSSVGDMISNAYDEYVPEMPSGNDLLAGAGNAAQFLGNALIAAEATGGPPGAILGGGGRLLTAAGRNAAGNSMARGARNLTRDGRRFNAAEDAAREAVGTSESLSRLTGKPGPIRGDVVYGNPFSPFSYNYKGARAQDPWHAETGARELGRAADEAVTEWATAPFRDMRQLPPPTHAAPNRLIAPEAQPIPSPAAYERAGAGRLRQQSEDYARDLSRGTATSPRQQALDDTIDDFMQTLSQVPREHSASVPRLIKEQAETTGASLRDVVSALERRGYRIDADSVPMHAYQGRTADGRWSKLDPEWAELLSIIRERAGRPAVRAGGASGRLGRGR